MHVYLEETEMTRERKTFQEGLKRITRIHPEVLLISAWQGVTAADKRWRGRC